MLITSIILGVKIYMLYSYESLLHATKMYVPLDLGGDGDGAGAGAGGGGVTPPPPFKLHYKPTH